MTKQNPPSHINSRTDISVELNKIRTLSCIAELQLSTYVATFMDVSGIDSEDATVMQGLAWIMSEIQDLAGIARDKVYL